MTATLLASPWVPADRTEMVDPGTVTAVSPQVSQVDNPGEHPIGLPEPRGSILPNPAVGGQGSSGKDRIGYSTGFIGIRLRRIGMTGKIWTAPAVTGEPVQGAVGQNKHANQLQAGVRQQATQYDGSLSANAASFVGSVAR